jgi:hypothetical protein
MARKNKRIALAVRVELDAGDTVKPEQARKAFVKALKDFAAQGCAFTFVGDEEVHVVKAERLLPDSPDEGLGDNDCIAWTRNFR